MERYISCNAPSKTASAPYSKALYKVYVGLTGTFWTLQYIMATYSYNISPNPEKSMGIKIMWIRELIQVDPGFHLQGGAGGKLPPQTLNLPPQSNS